jgi:hypothetical protein
MTQSITRHWGRRVRGTSRWLSALVLLVFGLYGARIGETQSANASISGHIIDPASALISDAAVTLTDVDTAGCRSVEPEQLVHGSAHPGSAFYAI